MGVFYGMSVKVYLHQTVSLLLWHQMGLMVVCALQIVSIVLTTMASNFKILQAVHDGHTCKRTGEHPDERLLEQKQYASPIFLDPLFGILYQKTSSVPLPYICSKLIT